MATYKRPECNKTNVMQWRDKLRDWWKEHYALAFAFVALFALISLFTFSVLDNVTGVAISGIIATICGSISLEA